MVEVKLAVALATIDTTTCLLDGGDEVAARAIATKWKVVLREWRRRRLSGPWW